jgi:hypothetical protein
MSSRHGPGPVAPLSEVVVSVNAAVISSTLSDTFVVLPFDSGWKVQESSFSSDPNYPILSTCCTNCSGKVFSLIRRVILA